jgi:Phage integrase family
VRRISCSRVTGSARTWGAEALQQHRARQLQERLELGGEWVNHVLVFPNASGKLRDSMNLLHDHFLPLLRRAGLPKMHFHALRQSAATMLLGRGVNPKIVSAMLGHSSVSLTLPRLKTGDLHDRRGEAVAVERTPASPGLLYVAGLPGPNRPVEMAHPSGEGCSTGHRLTVSWTPSRRAMSNRQVEGTSHPPAKDRGLSGPSL